MIEYHSLDNYEQIIKILKKIGYSISYSLKHRPAIHKDSKYNDGYIISKLKVLDKMTANYKAQIFEFF